MSVGAAKAAELVENYGLDSPDILSRLEDLCWELGAIVRYEELYSSEARLTVQDRRGVITVSSLNSTEGRQRFSLAHELGHFLLHRDASSSLFCNDAAMRCWFASQAAAQKESQANEFASELLLPRKLISPIVAQTTPSLDVVKEISSEYGTSITASAIRLANLSNEAIAVVAYRKDGVIWAARSKFFEEQKYWIERGPLDKYSLAYDAACNKDQGVMQSVDATAWLRLPDYLSDTTIKEQTLYFNGIDFGISLLWIDSGILIKY